MFVIELPHAGRCLVSILGIGTSRLKRAEHSVPDLRYGQQDRPTSKESDSCRAFFQSMYIKVAESLPDRFVRRGRARKRVRTSHGHKGWSHADSDSSFFEAEDEDEEEDKADLFAWVDKATDGPLHNIAINRSQLVKRFLPPGNVSELFDHYQVVQSMLAMPAASPLDMEAFEFCSIVWFAAFVGSLAAFEVQHISQSLPARVERRLGLPAKMYVSRTL